MVNEEQQEPFRSRLPVIGLAVYALAVVAGGPAVVIVKRAAPTLDSPLRVGLALAALIGVVLLLRQRRGRPLLALAASAAVGRALIGAGVVDPGRLLAALVEGTEMASVALALALEVQADRPRSRAALIALAIGAFGLKLAWGLEQTALVRYGGLVLLPLAVGALVAYLRGR